MQIKCKIYIDLLYQNNKSCKFLLTIAIKEKEICIYLFLTHTSDTDTDQPNINKLWQILYIDNFLRV